MSIALKRPVVVRETEWRFLDDRERRYAPLPLGVRRFIDCFDNYGPVEPFSFDVEVPA